MSGVLFIPYICTNQNDKRMKNATTITELPRIKGLDYEFTVNGNYMIIATTPKGAIKKFNDLTGRKAETVKQVSKYPFTEPR